MTASSPAAVRATLTLGMWQSNCYLVGRPDSGEVVVVDPGQGGAEAVVERLDALGVRATAVLLTHGHIDHLWAAPALGAALDVPVLLHGDDRWLWDNPAAGFGDVPVEALAEQFGLEWTPGVARMEALRDGQTLAFAGLRLTVRHTPGHTPGSSVFVVDDGPGLLLSGDLLFAGSVGRTDFPRGSWEEQMASLRRAVLPLADDVLVLAGHGPATTVGVERASNPYLAEAAG